MADHSSFKNRRDVIVKQFGAIPAPMRGPLPNVIVGDKVKITVDGAEGTIEKIIPRSDPSIRANAFVSMADGTKRMIPLGSLEKAT